ncbi:hypothetical protein [Aquirhabdus sp.]|uniref:hypothetical protein n=1 Tax=Aquirhabdus sp. TaxID=2824160 RepID=UPI00396CEFF3
MLKFGLQVSGLVLLLGLSIQVPAAALQIEGVMPDVEQVHPEALVKRFKVNVKGSLQFKLDNHVLTVTPWPQQLPKRLTPQYVSAQMMLHPAGPIRVIRFRNPKDSTPWLVLTVNGGQRSQLLPDQVVGKINEGFVYLLKATVPLRADLNQAVILQDDQTHECWQFVLLGTSVPKGAAKFESEPRADWAMRRLTACPSK